MGAPIGQAVAALCAGRSGKAVCAEVAAVIAVATLAWVAACLFLTMEPMP